MKKIWKIMILCMILCFFCAGCSNDDEMISELDQIMNADSASDSDSTKSSGN